MNAVKLESAPLEMQQIRVRMGQSTESDETDTVSLALDRYPAAEQGWLVDVVYDASKNNEQLVYDTGDLNQNPPHGWQGVSFKTPVEYLEGIGQKRVAMLLELGIVSIDDLVRYEMPKDTSIKVSLLRRLKTMSQVSLQLPPISLPEALLAYSVIDLIEQEDLLKNIDLSKAAQTSVYAWLLRLEVCFDDSWLRGTSLKQIIGPL